MQVGEQVSVTITRGQYAGRTLVLDVEEFLPYEPSAYVQVPGWNCAVEIAGESVWFFVDESGEVWDVDESIGICPAQEREYERRVANEPDHDAEDCHQLDLEAEDKRRGEIKPPKLPLFDSGNPELGQEVSRMYGSDGEIVVGCEGCGGYVERPATRCGNCR